MEHLETLFPPFIRRLCGTAHEQCGLLLCKCMPGFVLFSPVHGLVRTLDQRIRSGAVSRENRDSNTRLETWVDDDVAYTHAAWRLNRLEDLCGNYCNVLFLMDLRQQV